MEITQTISAASLIQQVQSRFKINNTNWRADALDWIGDTINEIGYHTGYEPKDVPVNLSTYRGKIPKEVVSVGHVKYNGNTLYNITDRDSMSAKQHRGPKLRVATEMDMLALNKETERLDTLKKLYLQSPNEDTLMLIEDSQRKVSQMMEGITYQNRNNDLGYHWYMIENGFIKSSIETGCIILDADVFILDDKGFPMVIDTFKYREACIWGMMIGMMLQGYVHPVVTFKFAMEQKDFYVARAQNEPKMMTIQRHQDFAEQWSTVSRGVHNDTLIQL